MVVSTEEELIVDPLKITLTRFENGSWSWYDGSKGASQFTSANEALEHALGMIENYPPTA